MSRSDPHSRSRSSLSQRGLVSPPTNTRSEGALLIADRLHLLPWGGVGGILVVGIFAFFMYQRNQTEFLLRSLQEGIVKIQSGKIEEAAPILENVLSKNWILTQENDILARASLAKVYFQQGKLTEAMKLLAEIKIQVHSPAYPSQVVLLMAGRIAEQQQDNVTARKKYEEASGLEGPFTGEAFVLLAQVAERMGDLATSKTAREKFLSNFPNDPIANIIQERIGK